MNKTRDNDDLQYFLANYIDAVMLKVAHPTERARRGEKIALMALHVHLAERGYR